MSSAVHTDTEDSYCARFYGSMFWSSSWRRMVEVLRLWRGREELLNYLDRVLLLSIIEACLSTSNF